MGQLELEKQIKRAAEDLRETWPGVDPEVVSTRFKTLLTLTEQLASNYGNGQPYKLASEARMIGFDYQGDINYWPFVKMSDKLIELINSLP